MVVGTDLPSLAADDVESLAGLRSHLMLMLFDRDRDRELVDVAGSEDVRECGDGVIQFGTFETSRTDLGCDQRTTFAGVRSDRIGGAHANDATGIPERQLHADGDASRPPCRRRELSRSVPERRRSRAISGVTGASRSGITRCRCG